MYRNDTVFTNLNLNLLFFSLSMVAAKWKKISFDLIIIIYMK